MGQVKDATELEVEDYGYDQIPTDLDPGKFYRLRKAWLYGAGHHSIAGEIKRIWSKFRDVNKRIDELEDRLSELDGIIAPRNIYHSPNVTEYHIKEFVKDDE
jgi:hypothetical protein